MARRRTKHLALIAFLLAIGTATPSVLAVLIEENSARAAAEANFRRIGNDANISTLEGLMPASSLADDPDTGEDTTGNPEVDDEQSAPLSGEVSVGRPEEFTAAIEAAAVTKITLTENITMPSYTWLERDLELDLGGHTLSSGNGNGVLLAHGGAVLVTGPEGSKVESTNGGVAIWVYGSADSSVTNAAMITIDENVTVATTNDDDRAYALAFTPVGTEKNVSYGAQAIIKGTLTGYNGITVHGQIINYDNPATIIIEDGAKIIANGTNDGAAIYAAGYGDWTIGVADISGALALGIKSGDFELNGPSLTSTAAHHDNLGQNNDGIDVSGAVIQVEDNPIYYGDVTITINDGTYISEHSNVFYEYGTATRAVGDSSALSRLTINDGEFTAASGKAIFSGINADTVSISRGTFRGTLGEDYIARIDDSSDLVCAEDGSCTVVAQTDPSSPSNPSNPSDPSNPGDSDGDDTSDPDNPSTGDSNSGSNTGSSQQPGSTGQSGGKKPSSSTSPDTGHYSPKAVAAVTSTAAAVIAGFLVAAALFIRHLLRRHHLEVESVSVSSRSSAKSGKSAQRPRSAASSATSGKRSAGRTARTAASTKTASSRSTRSAKTRSSSARKSSPRRK